MRKAQRWLASAVVLSVGAAVATVAVSPAVATSRLQIDAEGVAARSAQKVVEQRPAFLHASAGENFKQGTVVSFGWQHYVPYERTYHGLPVIGGDFVIVTDDTGQLVFPSVAQEREIGALPITAKVSAATAETIAAGQMAAVSKAEGSRLAVYALGTGPARLVWESTVNGIRAGQPSRLTVYVDANTGDIAGTSEHVSAGVGNSAWNGPNPIPLRTMGSGGFFTMSDPTIANLSCKNYSSHATISGSDDIWGNRDARNLETGCTDALYAAEQFVNMLSQWLGRNGTNGAGRALPVEVGLDDIGTFYDGTRVLVGHNGANQWAGALDMIAHEFGHAVDETTRTSSQNDTKEFVADAFGAATEWFVNEPSPFDVPDFLVGEQVNLLGGGPIRNMFNPSLLGHPSCYPHLVPGQDPHQAAGPGNHWFYLLAMGSNPVGQPSSPTCNGTTVTGAVGVRNAIRILYNAMLMKTTASSYVNYRLWTLLAAINLDRSCAMYNTAKAAWNAILVPVAPAEPTCTPV